MTKTDRARVWLLAAVLALLLGGHLALRVVPPWRELVQADGQIVLPENDPWFHYREALYTNAHFPAIQRTEDVSRYPEVERVESSGLWDVTLAGIARVAALGRASPHAVAWVCLLLPPLAGIGVLLLLFRVACVNGPPSLGAWLVAWSVLAPGSTLTRTGLGFCDHHVAEMALSLLCLLAVVRLLRRAYAGPAKRWWQPAWLEALPLVIFLFTWLGAPIYLLLTALVLVAAAVVAVLNDGNARPTVVAGTRFWLAFVIMAGAAAALWPGLVMRRDLFTASLAGAVATAVLLPVLGWALERAARRFGAAKAMAGFVALTAAALAIGYFSSADLRTGEGFLLGRKSPLVQENMPVTFGYYFRLTGLAGLIAIAAPAVGIVTGAWKRASWTVTVAWSFGLLMLWYRTWDYDYLGGLHALVLSGCAFGACAAGRTRAGKPALSWPLLATATAIVAVLALMWGIGGGVYAPARVYRERLVLANAGWREAMDWLHRQPPPPAPDFSKKLPRGRAGVLTGWMWGNLANTLGGWPAVSARYLDAEAIEPFFLADESAMRAAPLRGSTVADAVRYVVTDAALLGRYFEGALASSGRKLEDLRARESFADRGGRAGTFETRGPNYRAFLLHRLAMDDGAGLQHFRLVYASAQETFLRQTFDAKLGRVETWSDTIETPAQRVQAAAACAAGFWHEPRGKSYAGHIVPTVQIYEQVAAACVTGRALPGELVAITIPLRARAGRRSLVYRQTATTADNGIYVLTVPYATGPMQHCDVQTDGPAEVSCGTEVRPVAISDEAARAGDTVAGPDFRL
ncbi:MAG TPA: hypothetical protein VHE13_07455 [Opitutus sp.]|nr:hypothetical protein [Opitutus sp.]